MVAHSRTRCDPCFNDVRHSWRWLRQQRVNEWPYREATVGACNVNACNGNNCSRPEEMKSTFQLAFLFKATMLILSEQGIDPYTGNNRLDTRCVRWYSRESDRRPWGHRPDLETKPACVVVRPRHQAFVGLCQYFWVPAELVCFYQVCNGRQHLPACMHLIIYQYSKVTWKTTRQEKIIRYWIGVWGTADSWQEKAVPHFPLKIDFWG